MKRIIFINKTKTQNVKSEMKTLLIQWKKQNKTNSYHHIGQFDNQLGLELQFWWQHRTDVGVGFFIRSPASTQSVGARGGTVGSALVSFCSPLLWTTSLS